MLELEIYIKKLEKVVDKLDVVKVVFLKQKKLVKECIFEEVIGKVKIWFYFEEQEKFLFGGKFYNNLLFCFVQEVGIFVYNKIYSVEKDNFGVEGVYKLEEFVECGVRYGMQKLKQGYCSYKLKFYWEVVKVEWVVFKVNVNFQYYKVLQENLQFISNFFFWFMQK